MIWDFLRGEWLVPYLNMLTDGTNIMQSPWSVALIFVMAIAVMSPSLLWLTKRVYLMVPSLILMIILFFTLSMIQMGAISQQSAQFYKCDESTVASGFTLQGNTFDVKINMCQRRDNLADDFPPMTVFSGEVIVE